MAVACVQSASREVGKGDARRACVRGANRKHPLHACDAGRVEVQRLVERRRAALHALWLGLGYIGLRLGLGLELWFLVRFGGVWVRVRVIGFRIGLPKVKARRRDAHCSHGPGYTQEGMR